MNIEHAKPTPLERLVERLGGKFSRKGTGSEQLYFSPFRPDERTASFKIDTKTNTWHDFARTSKLDAHRDIIDLWTDYNNLPRRDGSAVKKALEALVQDFGSMPPLKVREHHTAKAIETAAHPPRYRIMKAPGKIWLDSLKAEVSRRRLSLSIVQPYLKQALSKTRKPRRNIKVLHF